MRKSSPLRVALGFIMAYAAYAVSSVPFMAVQVLLFRSAPLDSAMNPPAGYVLVWLVIRSGVNFALGYYAHSAVKRLLLPGETLAAMLAFAAAVAAAAVLGAVSRGGAALHYISVVPAVAIAAGAWMRHTAVARPRHVSADAI